jgi:hypothetical protein
LEIFWSRITEIPSKPEAIEDRENIAEQSSLKLKGADRICKPGSKLLEIGREDGHDLFLINLLILTNFNE